ncbi:MAG: hypothetical protein QM811_15965 [Pirellulales bacterium]
MRPPLDHDFAPIATPATLRARAELLATIRAFFEVHGLLEVETPLLSHDTVVDRHLDPFETRWSPDPTRPARARRSICKRRPSMQ